MAAEHEVRRRLTVTCTRVNIAADAARRVARHQLSAVGVLSDQLIRCGEVHDNRRAGERVPKRGRRRDPEVLADFRRHREVRHSLRAEQDVRPEGHLIFPEHNGCNAAGCRLKVSHLVELIIVREIRLRHKSEHPPVVQGRRDIIELALRLKGKTHENESIHALRVLRERKQLFLCRVDQLLLPEEIAALIAREAELRKHHNFRALLRHLPDQSLYLFPVRLRVGDRRLRRTGRDADKTLVHTVLLNCYDPATHEMIRKSNKEHAH